MIFELVQDFSEALAAMPQQHPRRRILTLMEEAIRRDMHFISRHSTTLFQCMWNTCWWHDCPQLDSSNMVQGTHADLPMSAMLEVWRKERHGSGCSRPWLRSVRPPAQKLGTGQASVLVGHQESVTCLAFSPDGLLIASGSSDESIRIWDAQCGRQITVLKVRDCPRSITHLQNGNCVAFTDDWGRCSIWDWRINTERSQWQLYATVMKSPILSLSPDGVHMATACKGFPIRLWNISTQRMIGEIGEAFDDHASPNVQFSPDGRTIAAGSGNIGVWDAMDGQLLFRPEGYATCFAFSPDGRRLAVGSWGRIRLWELRSGKEVSSPEDSDSDFQPESIVFAPDGLHVVIGNRDGSIRYLDLQSGFAKTFRGHHDSVGAVALSPDGTRMASASWDRTVRIWELSNMGGSIRCLDHDGPITSIAWASRSNEIATASTDREIRIWDVTRGNELAVLRGHEGSVNSVVYSLDGGSILSGSDDGTLRMWTPENKEPIMVIREPESPEPTVLTVEGLDGVCSYTLPSLHQRGIINSLALSSDGKLVATALTDGIVRVRHITSGSIYREFHIREAEEQGRSDPDEYSSRSFIEFIKPVAFPGREKSVQCLVFSQDGEFLACGTIFGTLHVWHLATATETAVIHNPHDAHSIEDLALSCHADRIAAVSRPTYHLDDHTSRIWSIPGGICEATLKGRYNPLELVTETSKTRFRTVVHPLETLINDSLTGVPIAWWSNQLEHISTCPGDHAIWAGAVVNQLEIFCLEDERSNLDEQVHTIQSQCFDVAHSSYAEGKATIVSMPDNRWADRHSVSLHKMDMGYVMYAGSPIVTVRQLSRGDTLNALRHLVRCPYCVREFPPSEAILSVIESLSDSLNTNKPPCLFHPNKAFSDPRLRSACPICGRALRFNPFYVKDLCQF